MSGPLPLGYSSFRNQLRPFARTGLRLRSSCSRELVFRKAAAVNTISIENDAAVALPRLAKRKAFLEGEASLLRVMLRISGACTFLTNLVAVFGRGYG